jgi:hypothetical protein
MEDEDENDEDEECGSEEEEDEGSEEDDENVFYTLNEIIYVFYTLKF